MDKMKTALPPAQKPDPESDKVSDLPREPEPGGMPEMQRASAPEGGNANRARRSTEMQKTLGNARTGHFLEGTMQRTQEDEQPAADQGNREANQEKRTVPDVRT